MWGLGFKDEGGLLNGVVGLICGKLRQLLRLLHCRGGLGSVGLEV